VTTVDERIAQLRAALAAQDALRPTLGDSIVETTSAALRAQLETLLAQHRPATAPRVPTAVSAEQLLDRIQSYLPKELAEKMRATGRIEGERKQVTVLFADISGFTALSERLDPEEVMTLTNEVLRELAEAVYQYEGYIDKFVGDSVMAVFGAPVSHEDDPERALRTALAMRERLEQFNRRQVDRLGEPLTLHIGVNTGPVVAGNIGSDLRLSYTVMGDTVNTAARLESAAQPGQVLVSRDTYRLAAEAFTFQALEPITVKGKREPVAVFELQRARLVPGKSRGLQDLASAFVGRERELALLRAAEQSLLAGHGHIVTVTGEAGLGKSRLLAAWRAELGERVRWLEGRAFGHTTALAYGPFIDLLRRYAGIRDDDSEAQARARFTAAVEQVFPGDIEAQALLANMIGMRLSPAEEAALAGQRAETLRLRLFDGIADLFVRLCRQRPTVLVIEDMHWADATSVELVEHLMRLTADLPLCIACIFRVHPGETPSVMQAIVTVNYADRFTHVPLTALDETASLSMVEQLLGLDLLPDSLRTLILQRAEGNPFFVEEMIRTLIERGALMRAPGGGGWTSTPLIESVAVPDTLQGLLMARLDRLPDETKWAVQQAAVIGRIFLYRVLRYIAEHNPGLESDLSHLEREELIRERSRTPELEYIFKHALTQEVAYQSLLAPRRKDLHRRVGEAMEAIFADRLGEYYSILAEHFLRGESWAAALDYFLRAGEAAMRLYAYTEARSHYTKALEALGHLPDSEDYRRSRVDTLTRYVTVHWAAVSPEEMLARLTEAESLAQQLPGPDGTPGGDHLRLARVQYWIGRAHYLGGAAREAIGYFRRVLAVAQELGDAELLAIPASVLSQAMMAQGHIRQAEPLLVQAVAALETLANWQEWARALGFLGIARVARGDIAVGLADEARALARVTEANYLTGIASGHIYLAIAHLLAGDSEQMLKAAQVSGEVAAQSGDRVLTYLSWGLRGWAESRLGHHAAAAAALAAQAEVAGTTAGRLILADWFAAARAEVALNAGNSAEAAAQAEAAAALAQSVGGIFATGLAERVWGQALAAAVPPDPPAALRHLAASVAAFETGGCPVEVARTHRAWGRVSLAAGDAAAAQSHLDEAATFFAAAGLTDPA
jgi:class 3 adenylate cyclase/tetratricopeptide (TPR) repeat protein